jgi:hypothetical protein
MRAVDADVFTAVATERGTTWQGPYGAEGLDALSEFLPPFALRCRTCGAMHLVEGCERCGSIEEFEVRNNEGHYGAVCRYCETGFFTWLCHSCHAENRVSETLLLLA